MAQVKLLKIDANGLPKEMDTAADDITLNSYTVDGGPVLDLNLDMNNGNISDVNDISFTDPTTDGITNTNGTFAADDIMLAEADTTPSFGTMTDLQSLRVFPAANLDVEIFVASV